MTQPVVRFALICRWQGHTTRLHIREDGLVLCATDELRETGIPARVAIDWQSNFDPASKTVVVQVTWGEDHAALYLDKASAVAAEIAIARRNATWIRPRPSTTS